MAVRIFLSTVSDEFRPYRDQLRGDLTRHNVEVKVQEDFKDTGGLTLEKLDLYIRNCDAVIHLVGDMTGAAAKPESTGAILERYPDLPSRLPPLAEALERGEDVSYTQWEAWLAIYHGKVLLIAQAAPAAKRASNFAATPASQAAQAAHLARLRKMERYPGATFSNPDHLSAQIAYTAILDLLAKERASAAPARFPAVPAAGALAIMLGTPIVADQWSKTLGVAIAGPVVLGLALAAFALLLIFGRYVTLLGAGEGRAGSAEWLGYEALRAGLAEGGQATRLYTQWLTAFLEKVDRFFGDAGKAGETLFPRAFWLKTPAPLWTAPAYDRCLLLALIYPVVTIYLFWAMSGHVGPAETALGLRADVSGWSRGLMVAAFGSSVVCSANGVRTNGWPSFLWLIASIAAVAFAVVVAGAGNGAAVAVFGAVAVAGAAAVAFAVALAVDFAFAGAFAGAFALAFAVVVAVAFAFAFAVAWLSERAIAHGWHGQFLIIFSIIFTALCLAAPWALASQLYWRTAGPLLLFLGLLTLLNAPFDWASLGLTRALLRRGLELQGWWPMLLALLDAALAGLVIVLLAITMVLGVQMFDVLAVADGVTAVLPLQPLFDGLATKPAEPEYWWVYALLLSTMIPSLLNLAIGGTALMRGLPGVSSLMLHFLPAHGAVPSYNRAWIATVLTAQVALGAALGIAAQVVLAYALFVWVMPAAGLGLLDLCRSVAELELPARLIAAFAS